MRVINRFLDLYKLPLTKESIERFIAFRQEKGQLTIAPTLSHLFNWQRINGQPCWSGDKELTMLASRAQAQNRKKFGNTKGTLNIQLYEHDLQPWMEAEGISRHLQLFVKFAVLSRFRQYQLRELKRNTRVRHDDSLCGWALKMDPAAQKKSRTDGAGNDGATDHFPTVEENEVWEEILAVANIAPRGSAVPSKRGPRTLEGTAARRSPPE